MAEERNSYEVQELSDFCAVRQINLSREEIPLGLNNGFRMLWHSISRDYFALVFFHCGLLFRICEALRKIGRNGEVPPLTLQTDWSGEVVFNDYCLGIIGLAVNHRLSNVNGPCADKLQRWRRITVPVIFVMSPFEDSAHIKLGLQWVGDVLHKVILQCGLVPSTPLFHQVLGDWSPSLRKAATKMSLPVTCDILHLLKNIWQRDDCPWNKGKSSAASHLLRASRSSFVYGLALFDV